MKEYCMLGRLASQHKDIHPALWNRFFFARIEGTQAVGAAVFWTCGYWTSVQPDVIAPLPPDTLAAVQYARDELYDGRTLEEDSCLTLWNAGGELTEASSLLSKAARTAGLAEDENPLRFASPEELLQFIAARHEEEPDALMKRHLEPLRHAWKELIERAQGLTREENRIFGLTSE